MTPQNHSTARPWALYAGKEVFLLSLFEFLERLEADPFDPALLALFEEHNEKEEAP